MAVRSGSADMDPCCQGQQYRARVRQLLPEPAEIDPFEAHATAAPAGPAGPAVDGAQHGGQRRRRHRGGRRVGQPRRRRPTMPGVPGHPGRGRRDPRRGRHGPGRGLRPAPHPAEAVQAARLARGQTRVPAPRRGEPVARPRRGQPDVHRGGRAPARVHGASGPGRPGRRAGRRWPTCAVAGDRVGVDFAVMASALLGDLGVALRHRRGRAVAQRPAARRRAWSTSSTSRWSPCSSAGHEPAGDRRDRRGAIEPLRLAHLWEDDDLLFARYVRA